MNGKAAKKLFQQFQIKIHNPHAKTIKKGNELPFESSIDTKNDLSS